MADELKGCVKVAVPAHALRGTLLNVDGKPAPKIEVTLAQDMGGAMKASRAAFDARGRRWAQRVVRGILIGAPVACLFALLLSADPAFANALGGLVNGSASTIRFVIFSVA